MNHINYDFTTIINTFSKIMMASKAEPDDLHVLKNELNRFFEDSKCKEVIYTINTDKMFFGMKIIPAIDADDIYDYLVDDEQTRIDKYIVEFDSKLFDPVIGLTCEELTAILLRDVSHVVGSSQPIENARNILNAYLAEHRSHIKISKSIHYKEILAYGLKDFISKDQSIFYVSDNAEILGDEFIISYGFGDSLSNAYNKLFSNNIKLYENCNTCKFIVFGWTLDLYRNIKTRRVGTIQTLNDLKQLTGSRLERMEMDNVIRRIHRIDDDSVITEASEGGIRVKIKEKLKKARLNNLRSIDSTFYELSKQVRNVEDENDALYLLRQINNNLAIVDEYRNSKDCDNYEIDKWNQLMDKLVQLREKLTSTVVYKNKNYGLFVNYPDIVENRY